MNIERSKSVIVSNGGQGGAGASKVTRDVTDIIAQIPPLVEALSGVDLKDLATKLPGLMSKTGPSQRKEA